MSEPSSSLGGNYYQNLVETQSPAAIQQFLSSDGEQSVIEKSSQLLTALSDVEWARTHGDSCFRVLTALPVITRESPEWKRFVAIMMEVGLLSPHSPFVSEVREKGDPNLIQAIFSTDTASSSSVDVRTSLKQAVSDLSKPGSITQGQVDLIVSLCQQLPPSDYNEEVLSALKAIDRSWQSRHMCVVLLQALAKHDLPLTPSPESGRCPLRAAIGRGDLDSVRLLVTQFGWKAHEYGWVPRDTIYRDSTVLDKESDLFTPYHLAIALGREAIIDLFDEMSPTLPEHPFLMLGTTHANRFNSGNRIEHLESLIMILKLVKKHQLHPTEVEQQNIESYLKEILRVYAFSTERLPLSFLSLVSQLAETGFLMKDSAAISACVMDFLRHRGSPPSEQNLFTQAPTISTPDYMEMIFRIYHYNDHWFSSDAFCVALQEGNHEWIARLLAHSNFEALSTSEQELILKSAMLGMELAPDLLDRLLAHGFSLRYDHLRLQLRDAIVNNKIEALETILQTADGQPKLPPQDLFPFLILALSHKNMSCASRIATALGMDGLTDTAEDPNTLLAVISSQLGLMSLPLSALENIIADHNTKALDAILRSEQTHPQLSRDDLINGYHMAITEGDLDCAVRLGAVAGIDEKEIFLHMLTGDPTIPLETLSDEVVQTRMALIGYFTSQPLMNRWVDSLAESIRETPRGAAIAELITHERNNLSHWLPYIARYTRRIDIQSVSMFYLGLINIYDKTFITTYVMAQKSHGEKMFALVEERSKQAYTTMTDNQDFYANERFKTMPQQVAEKDFSLIRNIDWHTPVGLDRFNGMLASRYVDNHPILVSTCEKLNSDSSEQAYQLSYRSRIDNKEYPLTSILSHSNHQGDIQRWVWRHTDHRIAAILQRDVEYLTQMINTLEVDPQNTEAVAKFKQLWLETFWLSSNLCRYLRGSAQYTQNGTNELCLRKGLPVPISRKEHPMLNTLAISLPLEDFLARADEFLEPWLATEVPPWV